MATDRSLHVHGGYGYAEEYDIQLYYRRARGWSLLLGDPAREARRLADQLFGPVTQGAH
jgi:alkylation response protein AidB-like acyl-CoA dehydrogenase